jgi:hypothetical protein
MPIAVALFARSVIQLAVTLGLVELATKIFLPLFNRAIESVVQLFGVSEEEAKDIVANEYLQIAEQLLIGAAVLRTQTPTVIAEKLGFTSKGWAKRLLKPATAVKLTNVTKSGLILSESLPVTALENVPTVIASLVKKVKGFEPAISFLEKQLGLTFLAFIAFNNLVDFGNWNSGAYQKTFQKIFAFVTFGTLVPDEDYRQTKTASPDVFSKVYNTYKLSGALSINDPYKMASVPFTRDNLIDLLDRVGADLLRTKHVAGTKDVLLATQLMISFDMKVAEKVLSEQPTATTSIPVPAPGAVQQVKVFTGLIQQGVLGDTAPFTARETDLIDSLDELKTAAANNLAQFLVALPGRVVYEIKIVNSVILKDGTKRVAQAQQVITGYTKSGKPILKRVLNRFAVIDVFVFTSRNVRSKIDTIILGPTDAVTLQLTAQNLVDASGEIKKTLTTTDTNQVNTIISKTPVSVVSVSPLTSPAPSPVVIPQPAPPVTQTAQPTPAPVVSTQAPVVSTPAPEKPAEPALPFVAIPPSNNPNRKKATSIAEYFDVEKLAYPTVQSRGRLYEAFGLGPENWYTGTAEQNIKLLEELKKRA